MKNTEDVTGGKPLAVLLQSISGVSAINPLVAINDIHGMKGEVLFFCNVPDTTRDLYHYYIGGMCNMYYNIICHGAYNDYYYVLWFLVS
jgi:hypothetical protein